MSTAADERCAGPHFPLVLANVYSARDGKPIFQPWTVVDEDHRGRTPPTAARSEVPLKVGIIGFTPPPIMEWDKQTWPARSRSAAWSRRREKYLPELQAQHPDLIVAILHGGLNTAPYTPTMENAGWHLAGVPGIDVLLLGHSHTRISRTALRRHAETSTPRTVRAHACRR